MQIDLSPPIITEICQNHPQITNLFLQLDSFVLGFTGNHKVRPLKSPRFLSRIFTVFSVFPPADTVFHRISAEKYPRKPLLVTHYSVSLALPCPSLVFLTV